MQRPHIVITGGTEDQPIQSVYCGPDGNAALEVFEAEANDGNNELVRLFVYPEHIKVATPKRYEVPPVEKPEADGAAPSMEDMLAAVARIEELSNLLARERARADECERSHKAAQGRVEKLEATIQKLAAKGKLVADKPQ